MHPKIALWLDQPAKADGSKGSVLSYLAELIAVNNGRFELTTFGQVVQNDSHWGRSGLTLQEALDLLNITSFLKGMMFLLETDEIWKIKELIQAEINRLEKGSVLYVPTSEEINAFGSREKISQALRRSKEKMDRG